MIPEKWNRRTVGDYLIIAALIVAVAAVLIAVAVTL